MRSDHNRNLAAVGGQRHTRTPVVVARDSHLEAGKRPGAERGRHHLVARVEGRVHRERRIPDSMMERKALFRRRSRGLAGSLPGRKNMALAGTVAVLVNLCSSPGGQWVAGWNRRRY